MIELYNIYCDTLLHPLRHFSDFKGDQSQDVHRLTLINSDQTESSQYQKYQSLKFVSLREVIVLSWPIYFVYVIYEMSFQTLPFFFATRTDLFDKFITNLPSHFETAMMIYNNYTLLFKFILFPLSVLIYFRIWTTFINLSLDVISPDSDRKYIDQIVINSNVSHLFLLLPIIGSFLTFIARIILIYQGIKHKLQLTRLQSLFTIVFPVLIILFLIFIMISAYSFIIFN